jgi:hypothetical protein
MYKNIILALIACLIASCSSFTSSPSGSEHGMCEELKHQIMFNGATTDSNKAIQDRSQMGELERSYRAAGCE